MTNQFEAIALNNHAVSLLEHGDVPAALESCYYALACLNDERERLAVCQCRLLNSTTGSSLASMFPPFSNDAASDDEDACFSEQQPLQDAAAAAVAAAALTAFPLLCQGKPCHVNGYEWVACKSTMLQQHPKLQQESSSSLQQPSQHNDEAAFSSAMDIETDNTKHNSSSNTTAPAASATTHSSLLSSSPRLIPPTHDCRLAFLSLSAVKIQCNPYVEDHRPKECQCDCATRWPIMFNVGVMNHVLALSLGEWGHGLLREAHESYLTAQMTIPVLTPFSDILRMLLGTQNNQISIYQEFAMHAEYRASLQLLTELLASIPSYVASTGAAADLEPSKIMDHEILLNLMVLTRNDSAPAA